MEKDSRFMWDSEFWNGEPEQRQPDSTGGRSGWETGAVRELLEKAAKRKPLLPAGSVEGDDELIRLMVSQGMTRAAARRWISVLRGYGG